MDAKNTTPTESKVETVSKDKYEQLLKQHAELQTNLKELNNKLEIKTETENHINEQNKMYQTAKKQKEDSKIPDDMELAGRLFEEE